ncbi:MAG: LysR family transcriptional regulator [Magnetovibrio sp.]|nr:LysR family transcriptional regulator [Magnetovibrio sp.]
MDWDKLRVFQVVAEAGSFTHAGETLNLSQSAVSRQVGGLEESLEVSLFHRHARGLILTEQGEVLYLAAQEVFNKLTMAEARLRDSRERPQGPLKITTTVAFGSVWLTSRIKEFLNLYPDIDVSLVLADSELDLSMREADVAIRMNPPRQPDLVQRRLMTLRCHAYAAPEYLKNHGMPKSHEDLDHHRIVGFGEEAHPPASNLNWLLEAGGESSGKHRAVLRVNSIYAIFRAVQSGVGIGGLPAYMSEEAGNLVEILPELRGPSYNAYFVYPEELRDCMRISVFRDFLIGKIKNRSE